MKTTIKNIFEKDKEYGLYFYKRATGKLPEMFSSVALSDQINQFYKKGMKVLDVACGVGHYLTSLRKRVDPEIDYFGVDFTPSYIKLAKKAFKNDKIFKVGNIEKIPFGDRSFDIVMANNVICHMPPNPLKSISELLRVSKKYVIIRTVFGERNYVVQEISTAKDYKAGSKNNQPEKVFDRRNVPLSFNYFNIYTEDYFKTAIKTIAPESTVQIIPDRSFKKFDNSGLTRDTGTKIINGMQVSGSLILDWRFVIIKK